MEENVSEICNHVLKFLNITTKKLGEVKKFVRRTSKLTAERFVQALVISHFKHDRVSLEDMCELLSDKRISITKQGLDRRFNAQAVELMAALFQVALKEFRQAHLGGLDILKSFSSVHIQDSSYISLPEAVKEMFPGYGGAASSAGLKLQASLNYLKSCLDNVEITGARVNDQSFEGHLQSLKAGGLYLQDLGYFKLSTFQRMEKAGSYFMSRYLTGTSLTDEKGKVLNLVAELKKSKGLYRKRVILGKGKRATGVVRLIAEPMLKEEVEKRRARLIEDARKKGNYYPSKELLELARWSIFVTNVPEALIKNEHIYLVYSLRWQIELFFKLCKSELGMSKIASKKPNRILCELYGKLISIVMLLYFCQPVRWQEKWEISYRKAYKRVRHHIGEFFRFIGSRYGLKKCLVEIITGIVKFASKDKSRKKGLLSYQKLMLATGQEVLR